MPSTRARRRKRKPERLEAVKATAMLIKRARELGVWEDFIRAAQFEFVNPKSPFNTGANPVVSRIRQGDVRPECMPALAVGALRRLQHSWAEHTRYERVREIRKWAEETGVWQQLISALGDALHAMLDLPMQYWWGSVHDKEAALLLRLWEEHDIADRRSTVRFFRQHGWRAPRPKPSPDRRWLWRVFRRDVKPAIENANTLTARLAR